MSRNRPEDEPTRLHPLQLPAAPDTEVGPVKAWQEPVTIRSYMPQKPDLNPMFLEKRVYQGSSGKVYPLPFIDRISTEGKDRSWQAVHLENEYLRLMVLPEIGGRIHIGLDKTNGYDFFYRQNVIKPALVGLAGPWISGGVEFNWPQHHRPATFMPVGVEIERGGDGSVTIWCGDHDPMCRMKGMHGVCLYPGRAYLELKVRLFNRTRFAQTFLWWANAAARVHEHYQSFFPTDVHYVADHAKRAIARFPFADSPYYGVDYAERSKAGVPKEERPRLNPPDGSYAANDLSWYANIPVPTSYMVVHTEEDFFGGYDHAAQAGMVHVANHHFSPGKKQWTWGNHEFGYAWDRNLTDTDGPYIELMAGVYTDNQPDFSFLAPGETKTFSQFWYPIRRLGVPQAANLDAAISLQVSDHIARASGCVTHAMADGQFQILKGDQVIAQCRGDLEVARTLELTAPVLDGTEPQALTVLLKAGDKEILRYTPQSTLIEAPPPVPARELPMPEEIGSVEELYLAGMHLEQYRHATRKPEAYWREALRREPDDIRSNRALGLWHLHRGEFAEAEGHLRRAIARLTQLNPNPEDGSCFYALGHILRAQHRDQEAYAAYYKATWNFENRSAAYHALAELDAARGDWPAALAHLRSCLRLNLDNLNARNLTVLALRRCNQEAEARQLLLETRALDPLDIWSRFLMDGRGPVDNQTRLDLTLDYARAGLWIEAISILMDADHSALDGSAPMVLYTLAWLHLRRGDMESAKSFWHEAQMASPDYCFPARLEEIEVLEAAIAANPLDERAHYYLGNLLYDRRRYEEAIAHWEVSANCDANFSTVWRNLGVGYFNVQGEPGKARDAFEKALKANGEDARVLYERDQLWKRIGEAPELRLTELERHHSLVELRDDLATELATLYNRLGRPEQALDLLNSRKFQPWEGGEGLVLGQWTRANLLIGRHKLGVSDPQAAVRFFEAAISTPDNLGEAKHLLANQSEAYYWLGLAWHRRGDSAQAQAWWRRAAHQQGDFLQMKTQSVSEMTFWSGLALLALEEEPAARDLFQKIERHSLELENREPRIEYFATSLPTMLLFDEDLVKSNLISALTLRAQALFGLGLMERSIELLNKVLQLDINHAIAWDLLQTAETEELSRGGELCI
jgi:tetratricopeptide (TPR) repeat protein